MTSSLTVVMSSSCCVRIHQECGKTGDILQKSWIQPFLNVEMFKKILRVVCNCRIVKNISRGEEGRVLPEDLHRILGETCWEPIRTEDEWRSVPVCSSHFAWISFHVYRHTQTYIFHQLPEKMGIWICLSIRMKHNISHRLYSSNCCESFTSEDCDLQKEPQKTLTVESTYKPSVALPSPAAVHQIILDWRL